IGFGSVTATGFEVRQYLLPDYSDERAMLEDAAGELTLGKTLVSYNGAAFDLNIIRERFIINRVDAEFTVRSHVDLLHTTRRLFKRRLGDCSLVNIERKLFGFHRRDDIPGYLVPSVFFSWLSEENADDMKLVLEHNRLDVLTLYFLLERCWRVFASGGRELEEVMDIYSLSRVYGSRKQTDRVVDLLDELVQQDSLEPDMRLYQAMALKRLGRWSEAVKLWTGLIHCRSRVGFLANIELAKYYEHRQKAFRRAHRLTSRAISISSSGSGERRQAEHRLHRLRTRMTRR
ncbi:MAG: ribonuclease H-like domain-containing protein, partial [Candidatus Zixiibacteriota bacterium]